MHFYALIFLEKINIQYFSSKKINWKKNSKNMLGALKILILSSKLWFCETFFWFWALLKLSKNCPISLDFSLFLLYFANIARFFSTSPKSPIIKARNRRFSAIGDLSPGQKIRNANTVCFFGLEIVFIFEWKLLRCWETIGWELELTCGLGTAFWEGEGDWSRKYTMNYY